MVGFFALVWIALVAILILSPDVYTQTVPGVGRAPFLVLLTAPIALLVLGVFRRWRWTFWLVMIAFFFGALRVPASILQIAGMVPASGPAWYEAVQGAVGACQLVIAIAMFAGYRRAGIWGEF